jgi:hypothetical protein
MQVRLLGFSLLTDCSEISLDDYVNHMISMHGNPHKYGEHDRFIFFNRTHSETYYVGLVVTVKDQKTYCELVQKSGNFIVKVNELDSNSSLMDFNFFVIHKATGFGMYQYYHQSFSVNAFGHFNAQRFLEFKNKKIHAEISSIPDKNRSDLEEKKINKKYKGSLSMEVLVRKENLQALIEELQSVKSFEYCFTSLSTDEPEFQPLKNEVKKEKTKLFFQRLSSVELLASAISGIVTKFEINTGRVVGTDINNVDRVLRIVNNPDNFGEYRYDDIASKINSLNVDVFEKSWVVQELLSKCSEYKHIFEAKVK